MKLKRSPVWFAFFILPIIPAVLGTLNYKANIEILKNEWYSLWTQHTLFTCYFFLPIMLGIYCAYIIRLENNTNNWNKILTMPVNRSAVFLSKLITTSFILFLTEIWIGILFVTSGFLAGLTTTPYNDIIIWCVFGTLGGIVISSVQLLISLFVKSFALPVAISLVGGISGLVFLAKHLGHIYPYSLMAYGMNSNSPQKLLENSYISFVLVCMAYIFIFMMIGSIVMSKKEM